MTALLPPCPPWCAEHRDHPADGPDPWWTLHRTAPEPIQAVDEDGPGEPAVEVAVILERVDTAAEPGQTAPYLTVGGVQHRLTVPQLWELSGQADPGGVDRRAAVTG